MPESVLHYWRRLPSAAQDLIVISQLYNNLVCNCQRLQEKNHNHPRKNVRCCKLLVLLTWSEGKWLDAASWKPAAMALCRFMFLLSTVSFADEEVAPACQFLQTGLHVSGAMAMHEKRNESASIANGICVSALSDQEWSKPMVEVAAHYEQDGWCVFGFMGPWASECAVSQRKRSVLNFAFMFQALYSAYNVSGGTPFALRLPDNRTLIIRDHTYPLDDLYCYVNGWYSLPRHEIVNNFSYLEEVSNRFCDHLAEIVPGYHNISLMEFHNESDGDEKVLENLMKNGADTGYVPQSVIDGMYLHAATKCVMRGHNRGAVCDLANCAARGCLSSPSSSQLLYTARGECASTFDRAWAYCEKPAAPARVLVQKESRFWRLDSKEQKTTLGGYYMLVQWDFIFPIPRCKHSHCNPPLSELSCWLLMTPGWSKNRYSLLRQLNQPNVFWGSYLKKKCVFPHLQTSECVAYMC